MSTAPHPSSTATPLAIATPAPLGPTHPGSAGGEPLYDDQIAEIASRLQQRYPTAQISPADLEDRVRGFHRQFDTARIRTFVAVFVERLVRRSMEQSPAGGPGTGAGQPQ